jgi:hypothetical protein
MEWGGRTDEAPGLTGSFGKSVFPKNAFGKHGTQTSCKRPLGRCYDVRPIARPHSGAREIHLTSPESSTVLAGLYRTMVRIRAFENAAEIASQGGVSAYGQSAAGTARVRGPLHLSTGQEAVATGVLRAPASRRLPHLHPPRARPHAGQGRGPGPHDGRAVRQGHGLQRRQGRLDAHRGFLRGHAGRQRRGGGRAADCGGRRARAEAAAGAGPR